VGKSEGKRTSHILFLGMGTGATTMGMSKRFFKLKVDLPYDLSISLMGAYLRVCKSIHKRDACIPMLIVALFTIAKLWNQLRCPTNYK
jgi:hypothetical protein